MPFLPSLFFFSAGVGTAIELWKVTKAMNVSIDRSKFPYLIIKGESLLPHVQTDCYGLLSGSNIAMQLRTSSIIQGKDGAPLLCISSFACCKIQFPVEATGICLPYVISVVATII